MKILFDHQKFSLQQHGGISRYFVNLNAGLNNKPGITSEICALYSENEYLQHSSLPLNISLSTRLFKGHTNRTIRWNRRYCTLKIRAGRFDVFHPTYYDPYFIKDLKRPFVITVHDMIHEQFPAFFPDSTDIIIQKKQLIEAANAIIAISNHTKNDLIKFFPSAEHKITVVHHGYTVNNEPPASLLLPGYYLLYVGERGHYKNFIPFVTAIAPIIKADANLKLICVGGGRFNKQEETLLAQLSIADRCVQITATDAELQQLYKQAQLFVFPSLQEGFGLPVLEAFMNNCAVVCSITTSLPEIAGDAALYFDPLDAASISYAVKKVLYDNVVKQHLIIKGQQQLQLFKPENCINKTLKVYASVL